MEVVKVENGFLVTELKYDDDNEDLPLVIGPWNIHEMPMPYEVRHVFDNSEDLVKYLDARHH